MNAMLANVDGIDMANEIRMLHGHGRVMRAVLVVEGPTDEIFFERYTDVDRCLIVIAHGRENALQAFEELRKDGFMGALFVVDADFDVLDGRLPLPPGLLFTDAHDLETMLIASRALDKLLGQVGQKAKIRAFRQQHGDVRERLVSAAASLGRLLWLSLRERHHLDFDGLKYGKFVDERTLAVDERKMVKTVLDHSQRPDLDAGAIVRALGALAAADHDPWHVVCGHHVTEILAIALHKALGSRNARDLPAEQVEHMLMLAYEAADFRSTRLHDAIRAWEEQSPSFVILRALS